METFVLISKITPETTCHNNKNPQILDKEILLKGSELKVKKISVSNADLGEDYIIHADTKLGELTLYNHQYESATWIDGQKIDQKDLRRAIFYIPSLILYWPIIPILIFSTFARP